MMEGLKIHKGSVLLVNRKVQVREWAGYLENNLEDLTYGLKNATILILAGRHGKENGTIGVVEWWKGENLLMHNHKGLVRKVKEDAKEIIEERKIAIELLNIHEYYNDKDELDNKALKTKILYIRPSIVLISICFSEQLDLRFVLEMEGIFPSLKLQGALRLATNGKQIELDPLQDKLLYTMADKKNIHKVTIIHGPEGSGKTLLGLEVTKMKLYHYLRKCNVRTGQSKEKVQVFVCGLYSGEARVAVLLKQLYQDTRDISDLCTLQFKPLADLQINSPQEFKAKIQEILQGSSKSIKHSIFFFDELFPNFPIDKWSHLSSMKGGVDFVLSIRHAFNTRLWTNEVLDTQTILDNEGIQSDKDTIFCQLTKSYRCTHQLITFMYHWLIHSPKEDGLFKEKSFIRSGASRSGGPRPLWFEVPNVEVFIQHVKDDDQLNNAKDVLVICDYNHDLLSIHTLGKYCKTKDWKFCQSNEVMGSEAKIVIIYDVKEVHFEALSRAVNQLIMVTTPKTKGSSVSKTLADIREGIHDTDTCRYNCNENGRIFKHTPYQCNYRGNAIKNLIQYENILVETLPPQVWTHKNAKVVTVVLYDFLSNLVKERERELEMGLRTDDDIKELINHLEKIGSSPLEQDVLDGKVDKLDSYADKLYSVNHQSFENNEFKGRSILHTAAQEGQLEVVEQLMQDLEDKNPPDEKGVTPLDMAVTHGHLSVVQHICSHLKDKNPQNGKGRTPLHIAALTGKLDIVEYLLQHIEGDINPSDSNGVTPLDNAAVRGHLNVVYFYTNLLKTTPNPGRLTNDRFRGRTPLHRAAEKGHLPVVQHICSLLKEKNPQDVTGVTPLHMAALAGQLHIVEYLLQHIEGDINPSKIDGITPLDNAAIGGHMNVVCFYTNLLTNPNPSKLTNDEFSGRTPLHHAAQGGHLPVVQHICSLLEEKNPKDTNDFTPLHLAASYGHLDIVKFLVQHVKDKHPQAGVFWGHQKTPLDIAKLNGHSEIVNFLAQF